MSKNNFIITALDIGTTFIRAAIAKCSAQNGIQIIGAAVKPSSGVKKSQIINPETVSNIARAAIETAEREANVEVDSVYASITGGHINSNCTFAIVNNLDSDSIIKDKHLTHLIENARANSAEKGRAIVHEIAQEYRLDGHNVEKVPEGSVGMRLESKVLMITADKSILENHGRVINAAGFKVDGVCWNIIADGSVILSEDEKKEGVLLIDVGGGSTGYAVYFNNSVYYANVFAVGGEHILNDLMIGLDISSDEAEDIVRKYFNKKITGNSDAPNIIQIGSPAAKTHSLNKADIEMIIESRVEEIIQFIQKDVQSKGYYGSCARGVVIVGGAVHLHYFKDITEKVFDKRVKIAVPKFGSCPVEGDEKKIYSDRYEFLMDPSCATILGLLKSGYNLKLREFEKHRGFFDKLFNH